MKTINCLSQHLTTIFILLLLALAPAAWATAYFSNGPTGDPTVTTSWTNSAGANPANFTTAGDTFVVLGVSTYTMAAAWSVAGNLQIDSGGTLAMSTSATAFDLSVNALTNNGTFKGPTAANCNLNITNSLANGGSFTLGSSGFSINIIFTGNSTWTGSGDISGSKISVIVNAGKVLDISNLSPGIKFRSSGSQAFTVNGTLLCGTTTINGNACPNAKFVLGASGTLSTANVNGITNGIGTLGTITNFVNTGSTNGITLPTTANYVFNGTGAQSTLGLPATVQALTDNNTGGTVTLAQQTAVTANVALAGGAVLSLPAGTTSTANTLVIGGVLQVAGTWGNTGSGAANIDAAHFADTGLLSVATSADAAHSTISPASASITANGLTTQLITVQARDVGNNNLTAGGSAVVISLASGTGTIGATTDNGNGTYTAIVTSPAAVGSGTFTATLGGTAVGTAVGASSSVVTYTSYVLSTATGGLWSAPTTWLGGVVPFSTDDVVIATAGASSVALDGTNTVNFTVHSLTINAGAQFSMSSIGTNENLIINGNLANNGSIMRVGGTPAAANTIVFNGTPSLWTGSGNLTTNKVSVTVNAGKTLDISGLSTGMSFAAATLSFTVNGTLIAGTQIVTGGGTSTTFTLSGGATLVTANVNGITNDSTCTIYNFTKAGSPALSTTANYVFNGTANQSTLGLPATVNNLTDNNTASTVTLVQQTAVTTTTTLAGGAKLSLPAGTTSTANTLVIGSVVQTFGTWGNTGSGATHIDATHFADTGLLSVTTGTADAAHATISPGAASITAGNLSTQLITVQARDVNSNNLTVGGSAVVISLASGTGTIGATTDNGNGTYTAIVTSPAAVGSGTFTATLGGTAVGTAVGASSSVVTYTSYVLSTASGGLWSSPTTWLGGVVPASTNDVVIATTNSAYVALASTNTVNYMVHSLTINAGAQFSLSAPGSPSTNETLTINGNLANNGSFMRAGGTPGVANTIVFNGTPSLWTGSGDISTNKVSVTVNAGKTLDISGLTTGMTFFNGTLAVTVNGTLIVGTQVLTGYNLTANNIFTLAAGGTLVTANVNGITNDSSCTVYNFKIVNLSTNANYVFNGTAAQGSIGLPATVHSLTDNNTGGTLTLAQQTAVTTVTTLAGGAKLSLPAGTTSTADTLVIGGSAQTSGTWGNTGSGATHIDATHFADTGLLSVATNSSIPTTPTPISYSVSGSTLTISWPAGYLGWILQSQTNAMNQGLGTNWVDVPGTAGVITTNLTINPLTPTAFFRLRYP